MHTYLKAILDNKQKEVEQLAIALADNEAHPLHAILQQPQFDDRASAFHGALTKPGLSVIAEIKRRSPSKAHIGDIIDPVALAKTYEAGGAAAISVLTDFKGFGGSLQDLESVASAVSLPVLRKDFIISPLQIAQARGSGASAILLIVAVLAEKTAEFIALAQHYGLSAIVEVHTKEEAELALSAGAKIIGINNRNLHTFETDLTVSEAIKPMITDSIVTIAESGISAVSQAKRFYDVGFDAVLIGESLVKNTSPAQFIAELNQATGGGHAN